MECKSAPTLVTSTTVLTASSGDDPADSALYRQVIVKLYYLSFTHPYIDFVVSKLPGSCIMQFKLTAMRLSVFFAIFRKLSSLASILPRSKILDHLFSLIPIGMTIPVLVPPHKAMCFFKVEILFSGNRRSIDLSPVHQ